MLLMREDMPNLKEEGEESRRLDVLNVDKLIEKAKTISLNSADAYAEQMWFDNGFNFHYISLKDHSEKVRRVSYWSFRQICKLINLPIEYVWHCFKNGRSELIVENLNNWLRGWDKRMLIREYHDGDVPIVRGVLSQRYSANVETISVLRALQENVDLTGFKVAGARLDFERLHLRLFQKDFDGFERLKEYGNVGDGIYGGFIIENSEVGQSRLNVCVMMYRLACTNGMIVSDNHFKIYAKRHVGINIEDFEMSMKRLPEMMNLFGKELSANIIKSIEAEYTEVQVERIYDKLKKDAQLSKVDIESIKVKREEKYSDFGTMWGIINAATDVAHSYDIDKRMIVERAATELMFNTNKF